MRFRSSTRPWSTTWTDSVWRRIHVSRSTRAILRARPSVIEGKPRLSKLRTWFGEQSRNRAAVSTDRYAGQVDDSDTRSLDYAERAVRCLAAQRSTSPSLYRRVLRPSLRNRGPRPWRRHRASVEDLTASRSAAAAVVSSVSMPSSSAGGRRRWSGSIAHLPDTTAPHRVPGGGRWSAPHGRRRQ